MHDGMFSKQSFCVDYKKLNYYTFIWSYLLSHIFDIYIIFVAKNGTYDGNFAYRLKTQIIQHYKKQTFSLNEITGLSCPKE
jgi:hypothetical protein